MAKEDETLIDAYEEAQAKRRLEIAASRITGEKVTLDNEPFNVIIIGHARHGKDTVADLLVKNHAYQHVSATGVILNEIIWPVLGPLYEEPEDCYNDRVNRRATWYDIIRARLVSDPRFVARYCFDNANIYTGCRSRSEFEAIKPMADFVIWVDAFGRGLPAEPETSMQLTQEDADVTVYNDRDLLYLEAQVNIAVKWMQERAHDRDNSSS